MLARDLIHSAVRNALVKDGWQITHDPFRIELEERSVYADLSAERTDRPSSGVSSIAIEIKSFIGDSPIRDLHTAVGQYLLNKIWMARTDPGRRLFLAVGKEVYDSLFTEPSVSYAVEGLAVDILIVDLENEEVVRWKTS